MLFKAARNIMECSMGVRSWRFDSLTLDEVLLPGLTMDYQTSCTDP